MISEKHQLYEGAIGYRNLDDGRVVVLYPMIFNVRLVIGPQNEPFYDAGWCYDRDRVVDALYALEHWDGSGAPPGVWKKEVGT